MNRRDPVGVCHIARRNPRTSQYEFKKFRPCVESGLYQHTSNRLYCRPAPRATCGIQEIINGVNPSAHVSPLRITLPTISNTPHVAQVSEKAGLATLETHPGCLALLLITLVHQTTNQPTNQPTRCLLHQQPGHHQPPATDHRYARLGSSPRPPLGCTPRPPLGCTPRPPWASLGLPP